MQTSTEVLLQIITVPLILQKDKSLIINEKMTSIYRKLILSITLEKY